MIPILTQNIKLIILHQSANDFTRAQQIGQLFNQYFQDKPNLIIGLQENFWQKGYQAIKQQLMPIIWGSEILNSGYNRCITENGGVSFLFNRTIYRIKNFSLLGINELPGLVYTQEDNAGMKHFKYLYSEGEEYFATKGILLAKMLDIKNNQEFFILNTHAQSTRPGRQDRIQTTLSQSASVGELICLLKKQYPNTPIIFMGDLNINRSIQESENTVYFRLLEECLPLTHAYEPSRGYKTYSVVEDGAKIIPGLIDKGLQEQEDLHLDHVFSDRRMDNVKDWPLLYQGRYKDEDCLLSDHRGLFAEVDLDKFPDYLCHSIYFGKNVREELLKIGKLRSGLNPFNCCTKRSFASILFEELCTQSGQPFSFHSLYRKKSRQMSTKTLLKNDVSLESSTWKHVKPTM